MKLLYITNGITGSGGLERVLSVKASLLAETLGHEVHILSLNEEGSEPFFSISDKIIRHSVSVKGNPIKYFAQYFTGIRSKVAAIKPDIISVCDDGLKGFFLPRIIAKKIPVIYERHASVILNRSGVQHILMRYLASDFCRFIVLTKGNLKEWKQNNTQVIPNPVSFYPEAQSSLTRKKVIAVGSHSYNKGYDLLLNSWKLVEDQFPDWSLEIYGRYQNRKNQELAERLKLNRVHFYNAVRQIDKKYLDSSVFVLPSRSEGFGMVIIEAMACGLPVVSFDCPHGPADIITHEEDGFLVENGNIVEFSERLSILMRDQNVRRKFGSKGRQTAVKYKAEEVVKQWDILFKSLIK